jgi:cytochrome c-type biogenesis protein CcmH
MSRRLLPRLALLFVCVAAPSSLCGQTAPAAATPDTAVERKVRDVASMLRCPVCLNLSVQDSPSELARDMRDLVRERITRGEGEQQVLAYFVQRYGEWVLMKPPAHGVSLFVWVLPAVMVVGGSVVVVLAMRRWVGKSVPAAATEPEIPEADLKKVREALSREREVLD